MAEILRNHARNTGVCLIRGLPKEEIPDSHREDRINGDGIPIHLIRRGNDSIDDNPSFWLPIDIDSLNETLFTSDWETDPADYLREVIGTALPDVFHHAGCVDQFSASHGVKESSEGSSPVASFAAVSMTSLIHLH